MRFLIDRCTGPTLAEWLRSEGHDVVETREWDRDPGDEAILQFAVDQDRIVITIDKDFGELVFVGNKPHRGLVRLPSTVHSERIIMMARILASHASDLEQGAIITIKGDRIRVTQWP